MHFVRNAEILDFLSPCITNNHLICDYCCHVTCDFFFLSSDYFPTSFLSCVEISGHSGKDPVTYSTVSKVSTF